jgi:hypothetical protein
MEKQQQLEQCYTPCLPLPLLGVTKNFAHARLQLRSGNSSLQHHHSMPPAPGSRAKIGKSSRGKQYHLVQESTGSWARLLALWAWHAGRRIYTTARSACMHFLAKHMVTWITLEERPGAMLRSPATQNAETTTCVLLEPSTGVAWVLDGPWSPSSHSIWSKGSRLWKHGFFGLGTHSRAACSWLPSWELDAEHKAAVLEAYPRSCSTRTRAHALAAMRPEESETSDLTPPLERYQLMPEEVVFLHHELKCASVRMMDPPSTTSMSPGQTWQWYCHHPIAGMACGGDFLGASVPASIPGTRHPTFPWRYAAYHYFRARGWVVRSGVKFGVDFLLYQHGPVYRHSDFAVLVIPVVGTHSPATGPPGSPWMGLLGVTRVNVQARKRVILCFVALPGGQGAEAEREVWLDPVGAIQHLHTWHVVLDRWLPSRTR